MYKFGFGPVLAFDGALWAWDNVGHVAKLVVDSGKDLFHRMYSPTIPRQQLPSPEMLHKKQLLSDLKLAHYALNILPDGISQDLYGQISDIRDAKPHKGIDPKALAMAQSLQVVNILANLGKGIHDDRTHSPITLHGCS